MRPGFAGSWFGIVACVGILVGGCARRAITIEVLVDGKPDHGAALAAVEASRPQLERCHRGHDESRLKLALDVDASGRATAPFIDHPMPVVACVRDVVTAIRYPPGPAHVDVVVVSATR